MLVAVWGTLIVSHEYCKRARHILGSPAAGHLAPHNHTAARSPPLKGRGGGGMRRGRAVDRSVLVRLTSRPPPRLLWDLQYDY